MKGLKLPCAVVLVNLGTPAELSKPSIAAFLREFLGDRRVVELTPWLWQPILRLFILPFRPRRLMETYGSIWTEQGSPMAVITRSQAAKLQQRLSQQPDLRVKVVHAMTYGEPRLHQVLDQLYAEGVRRLVILPLYPQYSGSTTAAVYDQVARHSLRRRTLPGICLVNAYFYQPAYIQALKGSIEDFWSQRGRPDHLLFSYHGIPQAYADKGDPYPGHCECTTAATVAALGLSEPFYSMAYQSRFGRAAWLEPAVANRVVALAEAGVRRLDIVCPAFAADCLETLEEIAVEVRDLFLSHGGEELNLIPCLNDSERHIDALESLLKPYLLAMA